MQFYVHFCCSYYVTSVVSDSVRPPRWQPTRLPRPWDSPGKNTGMGCHCLLQCKKMKSESEVAQLCPTLSDPMDCSPPGFSIHGISQARVLEWGAIAFCIISTIEQNESTIHIHIGFLKLFFYYGFLVYFLEKAMALHSSTLAWKSLEGCCPWGC